MGDQLSKMEDWDRISQCITQLNLSRSVAETETVEALELLIEKVEECKQMVIELGSNGENLNHVLNELVEFSETTEISSRKRDEMVLSSMSHLKQSVGRVLETDTEPEALGITAATPEQLSLMDKALLWHFLHEGYLNTAQTFSLEAGLDSLPDADVTRVRSCLEAAEAMQKRKDLGPAIAWLEEYASGSSQSILFDFHRLRCLQLSASHAEAISYAQRNFPRFASSRGPEIESLFSSLVPHNSPGIVRTNQGTIGDEKSWELARESLIGELKRPYGSISTLISTGSKALPQLQIFQTLVGHDSKITTDTWTQAQELPIHIETSAHYHSEFCCPVSQEQSDPQNNPPMLLLCGHVIAKNSIARIAKHRQKFKCPTCPTEQSVDAPTPIQF